MPRPKTPQQREAWAAYMREYRKKQRQNGGVHDQRGDIPTERQIEILKAYANPKTGGSQKRVADQFGISVSAVNNALQRLMKRLGVSDPAQAVFLLYAEGTHGTTEEAPEPQRRTAAADG